MHQHSFFALTGHEWNQLPDDTKQLSYRDFKKYITQQLSTPNPPLYYLHGTKALDILHTRLRTDMSQLNANTFKIQKSDTPACSCGHSQENTAHFILSCPKYTSHRNTLFHNLSHTLNPRPAGPLDFPPPAGGGGRLNAPPPMISAPGRRREKQKAAFESSRKIISKSFRSFFVSGQN